MSEILPDKKLKCDFCRSFSVRPVLGDIVSAHGVNVHENCLYTASGLVQRSDPEKLTIQEKAFYIAGFDPDEVKSELKRGSRLRCRQCGVPGACVGCSNAYCRGSFHLPCLFDAKGFTVFKGAFNAFCSKHRPMQDLKSRLVEYNEDPPDCCICLFGVLPDDDLSDQKRVNEGVHTRPGSVFSTPPNRRKSVTIDNQQICPVLTPARKQRRRCNSLWEVNTSAVNKSVTKTPPRLNAWQRHLFRPGIVPSSVLGTPMTPKTPRSGCTSSSSHSGGMTAYESWSHGVIHGGCCWPAWMHRDCAAGYAKSAGLHHIKCPLCFNRDTFIDNLQTFGIWIPDRDAAWELEPGAFAYPEDPPGYVDDSSDDGDHGGKKALSGPRELKDAEAAEVISISNDSSSCQIIDHQVKTVNISDHAIPPPQRIARKRLSGRRRTATTTAVRRRRTTKIIKATRTPTFTEGIATPSPIEPQRRLSIVLECSPNLAMSSMKEREAEDKENRRPSLNEVLKFPSPQSGATDAMKSPSPKRLRTRAKTLMARNVKSDRFKQTVISTFFQSIDLDEEKKEDGNGVGDAAIVGSLHKYHLKRTNDLFRSMVIGSVQDAVRGSGDVHETERPRPRFRRVRLRSDTSGSN